MKYKLSLACMMLFGVLCGAQTELSQKQISSYTNSVPVTTNLVFYLSSLRLHLFPATQFKTDEIIYSGLVQTPISLTKTSMVEFYRIPYSQTFNFHLFDVSGRELEKTKAGTAISQPVNPSTYGRSMEDHLIGRDVDDLLFQGVKNNDNCYALFRPDEIFVITNKGIYDLSISMRICVPMTNGVVDTNALMNFHARAHSRNFGVVESSPLHVKVIKE